MVDISNKEKVNLTTQFLLKVKIVSTYFSFSISLGYECPTLFEYSFHHIVEIVDNNYDNFLTS